MIKINVEQAIENLKYLNQQYNIYINSAKRFIESEEIKAAQECLVQALEFELKIRKLKNRELQK